MPNSLSLNQDFPNITKSLELYKRAEKLMPPVTQTLAKGPGQWTLGVAPIYLTHGKGARVWDVDGNEYLDWNAGIGPLSLGYAYDKVDKAIADQLKDGIAYSLIHQLELEVCELIHEVIPNAENIRISKTGADVCSAAIRVARAFTKRNKVLCCGYHGWHDWYIGTTTRDGGIPSEVSALTEKVPYNDIEALKAALTDDVACFILEPMVFEAPKEGYLEEVLELCKANGTLLIFDEMWTGFRLAVGGAQEYFGIKPDLAVYSKAVANGMPISFLTGRKDVMHHFLTDVFFFTTFGGEALSLAATKATIEELREKNVPAALAEKGKRIRDGFNAIVDELGVGHLVNISGYDARTLVGFSPEAGDGLIVKTYVQQEMIKRGILWAGFHNVTYTHTNEEIDFTLEAYREVLALLKDAVEKGDIESRLKGKPLEAVFRKTKF